MRCAILIPILFLLGCGPSRRPKAPRIELPTDISESERKHITECTNYVMSVWSSYFGKNAPDVKIRFYHSSNEVASICKRPDGDSISGCYLPREKTIVVLLNDGWEPTLFHELIHAGFYQVNRKQYGETHGHPDWNVWDKEADEVKCSK